MEKQQANTKLLTIDEVLSLRQFPKKFNGVTFKNMKGFQEEKKIVMSAIKNNRSLFIWGECGTGKTHLAIATAKYWMGFNKPLNIKDCPLFVSNVEIFSELRDSFDNGELEKEIFSKYLNPPILICDDFGQEKNSDWVKEITFKLIDKRDGDKKPMVITSNLSLSQISNLYGDSIASRIAGMGDVIELGGKDFRLLRPG